MGSSLAQNSKRPRRNGLNGFPPAGRRNVWRALALLEDDRVNLGFWTVTLPPEALDQLEVSGRWPEFQDRVRKELVRLLQRAGLRPLVVGVVELQPKRTRREGRPCPHLHVVFRGRRHRWEDWAISTCVGPHPFDSIIRAALATAGVFPPDGVDWETWLMKAGKIESIKKSVRAYLACYMTKDQGSPGRFAETASNTLIPHQWWFWSAPMRKVVLAHIFPLPFDFIFWCHRNREVLVARGLLAHRELMIPDPRAPRTWEFNWLSVDRLASVIALWELDSWDATWHSQAGIELPAPWAVDELPWREQCRALCQRPTVR
jgi:hypothetical protein